MTSVRALLRLFCGLGLHWGEWRPQPNFHSQHLTEIYRCTRCPFVRVRSARYRRFGRRHINRPGSPTA